MALTDYLKALVGIGNTTNGKETPGAVQPRDIYTPGVEQFLSAVPALIGAYAASRPQGGGLHSLGRPLEMLGQLGMTNAANRQTQQQQEGDIAARLESARARGVSPNMATMEALNRMSPGAANTELSSAEAEQRQQQQHAITQQEKLAGETREDESKLALYQKEHPQNKSGVKEAGLVDALRELGVDPNGPVTPQQLQAARRQQIQDQQRLSMGRKMGTAQGVIATISVTPIGMLAKGAGVYIPNKDGSYTPINGIVDPRASYGDYNAGKIITVAPNEVIPFNQNQSAIKSLQQLKKVINSPEVKDKYIPLKPGVRSFLGDPLRAFVAMVDPSAAAAPVITATIVAEAMAKGLTNRTIQAQLKLLREGVMNGHGTLESTGIAIDAAITLLQQSASTMTQHGAAYTSKAVVGSIIGAEPSAAVAEPPPDSDDYEDR